MQNFFFRRIFGRMEEFRNNEWNLKPLAVTSKAFFQYHRPGYQYRGPPQGVRISLCLMLFCARIKLFFFANTLYIFNLKFPKKYGKLLRKKSKFSVPTQFVNTKQIQIPIDPSSPRVVQNTFSIFLNSHLPLDVHVNVEGSQGQEQWTLYDPVVQPKQSWTFCPLFPRDYYGWAAGMCRDFCTPGLPDLRRGDCCVEYCAVL